MRSCKTHALMHVETHFKFHKRTQRLSSAQREEMRRSGWVLLFATCVFFIAAMYALVVSKLMPFTGIALLDSLKSDWYYCFLWSSMVPAFGLFILCNWITVKFFLNN